MVAANSRIREALTLRDRVSIEVCHLTGFKHVFFPKKGWDFRRTSSKKKNMRKTIPHTFFAWTRKMKKDAWMECIAPPFQHSILETWHNSVRQRTEMVFLVAPSRQNKQLTTFMYGFLVFCFCVFFSKLNVTVFCCSLQQCLMFRWGLHRSTEDLTVRAYLGSPMGS